MQCQPDPLIQEDRRFWRDMAKSLIAKSPGDLDDKAKHLFNISSIFVIFYFITMIYSNKVNIVVLYALPYLLPLICFFVSTWFSLFALISRSYEINMFSSEAMKAVHTMILQQKYWRLKVATVAFIVGLMALIFVLWVSIFMNNKEF